MWMYYVISIHNIVYTWDINDITIGTIIQVKGLAFGFEHF